MADDLLFWRRVDRSSTCWLWMGGRYPSGYGKVTRNGRTWLTHRYAYALRYGQPPSGMCVCHACDNPQCVNPEHLFVAKQADNMADMKNKGRSLSGNRNPSRLRPERLVRGEAHHQAKLTAADVRAIRDRYALGGITQRQLAGAYRVTQRVIWSVLRRHNWREVA